MTKRVRTHHTSRQWRRLITRMLVLLALSSRLALGATVLAPANTKTETAVARLLAVTLLCGQTQSPIAPPQRPALPSLDDLLLFDQADQTEAVLCAPPSLPGIRIHWLARPPQEQRASVAVTMWRAAYNARAPPPGAT